MRELKSTQRRRRLRIIKAKDARSEERIRSAASGLENSSHLQKSREDAEQNRQRLADECGAQLPTRFRVEHPAQKTHHVLMNQSHLLIGSHPDCDLQLDHDAVHPHHGSLQWVSGHLFYCDLEPRTGSDQTARSNGHWVDDRPISIGPYQLFWEANEYPVSPAASPLDRSPLFSAISPQLALQFLGVEQSDNKWPINRLLTMIGRGTQCKLRLNHPSMPHVQACLLRTENGCWLIDVVRAGTTGVNGRAIRKAAIGIGDVLQLGPFRVEVVTTTFAPINVAPQPPVHKDENPARRNVKLFAPSTADLGLPDRTSSRKTSPPPKSPSLVDSSDTNSALTEISKNSPPGRQKKRPAPKTSILESGRSRSLNTANPSAESTSPPRPAADDHDTPRTSAEKPSIAISPSTIRVDGEMSELPDDLNTDAAIPDDHSQISAVRLSLNQAIDASVEEFVRGHQVQLARLQAHLDQLKQVCDRPSRRSISKRVRSQLEKTILDTLRTRDEMQESLALFLKSVQD